MPVWPYARRWIDSACCWRVTARCRLRARRFVQQAARHAACGFGHARAGAHQPVGLVERKDTNSLFAQRAKAGPAGSILQSGQIARADHDQVRVGAHNEFGVELGKRPEFGRNDVAHAEPRQRLADERGAAGSVGGRVDFKIDPALAHLSRQRLCCGRHGGVDLLPDAPGFAGRQAQRLRHDAEHALHIGVGFGFEHQRFQAERFQPVSRARRDRQQHQVGPQRNHGFDVRVQSAAELRQARHRSRVVGIAIDADQSLAQAEFTDGFGQRRQQTDDALWGCRQLQQMATVVGNFDRRSLRRRAAQRVRQQQRQRASAPAQPRPWGLNSTCGGLPRRAWPPVGLWALSLIHISEPTRPY